MLNATAKGARLLAQVGALAGRRLALRGGQADPRLRHALAAGRRVVALRRRRSPNVGGQLPHRVRPRCADGVPGRTGDEASHAPLDRGWLYYREPLLRRRLAAALLRHVPLSPLDCTAVAAVDDHPQPVRRRLDRPQDRGVVHGRAPAGRTAASSTASTGATRTVSSTCAGRPPGCSRAWPPSWRRREHDPADDAWRAAAIPEAARVS